MKRSTAARNRTRLLTWKTTLTSEPSRRYRSLPVTAPQGQRLGERSGAGGHLVQADDLIAPSLFNQGGGRFGRDLILATDCLSRQSEKAEPGSLLLEQRQVVCP